MWFGIVLPEKEVLSLRRDAAPKPVLSFSVDGTFPNVQITQDAVQIKATPYYPKRWFSKRSLWRQLGTQRFAFTDFSVSQVVPPDFQILRSKALHLCCRVCAFNYSRLKTTGAWISRIGAKIELVSPEKPIRIKMVFWLERPVLVQEVGGHF